MVYGRRYGRGGLFPWPPRRVHMLRHAVLNQMLWSYLLLFTPSFFILLPLDRALQTYKLAHCDAYAYHGTGPTDSLLAFCRP